MHQRSFGSVEYAHTKVKTRRQQFLERMDRLVPWAELEGRIAPVYPQRGRGRRPYPLRVMLRIHCLQLWFNLSDPGMEQELYDSRREARTPRYGGNDCRRATALLRAVLYEEWCLRRVPRRPLDHLPGQRPSTRHA